MIDIAQRLSRFFTRYLFLALSFALIGTAFFSGNAWAFKIKGHVLVGYEVYKSLKSCTEDAGSPCIYLYLKNGGMTVSVRPEVANAILAHPETFLIGNYGPDAFPDMPAGQLVIHPGLIDGDGHAAGFGTGDWLKHILAVAQTPHQLALAYGYLGHAAGDTFAHTYVNMMAGDVFSLTDGEQDVEERHTMIEAFIDKYTPEVEDNTYKHIMRDRKLDVPFDFVYETFIKSEAARNEMRKEKGAHHLIGMENHLRAFDHALHIENLGPINFDAKRFMKLVRGDTQSYSFKNFLEENWENLKDAGLVQKIEVYVAKAVVSYYTGIQLESQEAEKVAQAASTIHDLSNDATVGALEEILKVESQINDLKLEAATLVNDIVRKFDFGAARGVLKVLKDLQEEKSGIEKQIAELMGNASYASYNACRSGCDNMPATVVTKVACDVTTQVTKSEDKICEKVVELKCPGICGWRPCMKPCGAEIQKFVCGTHTWVENVVTQGVCDQTIANAEKDACYVGCEAHKTAADLAIGALAEKRRLEGEILDKISKAEEEARKVQQQLAGVAQELIEYRHEAEKKKIALKSDILDNYHRWTHSFRRLVEEQRDDVKAAIEAYIEANVQAMTNSMNHDWWENGVLKDGNESITKPYKEWLLCYGPVLAAGIPKVTGDSLCAIKKGLDDFKQSISDVENTLLSELSFNGTSALDIKESALEQGPYAATEKMDELVNGLRAKLGLEDGGVFSIERLHNGFSFDGKDSRVDELFARNNSYKTLITFSGSGSITNRIKRDMNLGDKSAFKVNDFPIFFNAIQLAKLALLDAEGLNRVLSLLNFPALYDKDSSNNILTDWLRSIDGNHQWLPIAPMYPRRDLSEEAHIWEASNNDRSNLRRIYSYGQGLPLFTAENAREEVFLRLFKGPLSPGFFDLDGVFGAELPPDYHYQPSYEDPFPYIKGFEP